MSFPGGSVVENLPANAGGSGLVPGSGRCPRGGNDNPLQYTRREKLMDKGALQATVPGVAKSQTQLSMHVHSLLYSCFMFYCMNIP